jgi:hypothetical protein
VIPKVKAVRDDDNSLILLGGSGLVIRIAPPPSSELAESPYIFDATTFAITSDPQDNK